MPEDNPFEAAKKTPGSIRWPNKKCRIPGCRYYPRDFDDLRQHVAIDHPTPELQPRRGRRPPREQKGRRRPPWNPETEDQRSKRLKGSVECPFCATPTRFPQRLLDSHVNQNHFLEVALGNWELEPCPYCPLPPWLPEKMLDNHVASFHPIEYGTEWNGKVEESKLRVLFICSGNTDRSPTARDVFAADARLDVLAAGLDEDAPRRLSEDDLWWAELVFVMEPRHRDQIRNKYAFWWEERSPILTVLRIPDKFNRGDPELVRMLGDLAAPIIDGTLGHAASGA